MAGYRSPGLSDCMYLEHYGLHEPPFSITPDPRFVFLSERHRDALAHLLYGISQGGGGGFVQLTGEVGTGKTTVCRLLLEQLPPNTRVALLLNPRVNPIELLEAICEELRIPLETPDGRSLRGSSKALVDALNAYLLAAYARGERVVLIIDEAQNLAVDALEQVRLLTNLETDTQKLLQIALLGQPELRDMLARADLRQLAQRITARYHLTPLTELETAAYLRHRFKVAGGRRFPFDMAAVKRMFVRSGGIPRLLNVIAERTLLAGYARDADPIGASLVDIAADEALPGVRPAQITGSWKLPWSRGPRGPVRGVAAAPRPASGVPGSATDLPVSTPQVATTRHAAPAPTHPPPHPGAVAAPLDVPAQTAAAAGPEPLAPAAPATPTAGAPAVASGAPDSGLTTVNPAELASALRALHARQQAARQVPVPKPPPAAPRTAATADLASARGTPSQGGTTATVAHPGGHGDARPPADRGGMQPPATQPIVTTLPRVSAAAQLGNVASGMAESVPAAASSAVAAARIATPATAAPAIPPVRAHDAGTPMATIRPWRSVTASDAAATAQPRDTPSAAGATAAAASSATARSTGIGRPVPKASSAKAAPDPAAASAPHADAAASALPPPPPRAGARTSGTTQARAWPWLLGIAVAMLPLLWWLLAPTDPGAATDPVGSPPPAVAAQATPRPAASAHGAPLAALDQSGLRQRLAAEPADPVAAWGNLLALWNQVPSAITINADGSCSTEAPRLQCLSGKDGSIERLLALDRPALLPLRENGVPRWAVLIGADPGRVRLALQDGLVDVDRRSLQSIWNGDYFALWLGPEASAGTLSTGKRGPGVAWLREQLGLAGTPDVYDDDVAKAVRRFQKTRGLQVDGRAGAETQMALAEPDHGPHLLRELR